MKDHPAVTINGSCAPEFDTVRDAFLGNFADHDEIGAAVAIWVEGDLVVNLWGGYADAAGTEPWREDTLASIYSGTKGLTSTCVHLLVDRGEIDLDAPVAAYWPEFGQAGKDDITVGMVMSHRSGVIGPRERLTPEQALTGTGVRAARRRAAPWWEPGSAQGYHMVTFGFILGEVVRRVTGRTIGQYLRTEIAEPLGIDVHIGLPACRAPPLRRDGEQAARQRRARRRRRTRPAPPRSPTIRWPGCPWRWASCPTTNSARTNIDAVALGGIPGHQRHVSRTRHGDLLQRAGAGEAASARTHGPGPGVPGRLRHRPVLGPRVADHGWGLGYMLNQRGIAGPNPKIFGHGGSGGSFAFVDLEHRIGYAYVMNNFDATKCNADPRSVVLSTAVYSALGVIRD